MLSLARAPTARPARAARPAAPVASSARLVAPARRAGPASAPVAAPLGGRLAAPTSAPARSVIAAAASDPLESVVAKVVGPAAAPKVLTLTFVAAWYALNVGFNLLNKTIFGYFPFPWTVSAVHVVVGLAYCSAAYALGAKKASFGRAITKDEFKTLLGPASMHAVGHIAANLSFAAVAISLTHTIKTLEPAFNVLLSKAILGTSTPPAVMATLLPIMGGVALASASDLSFNWTGFIGAMVSNLTFGFRAVWSKKAMGSIKNLDSTAIYAWTTLISVLICVPAAAIFEGPALKAGVEAALKANPNFWWALGGVGLLYHLYNQFAFNTLSRISPVSHGVCNVVKRIVIIGTSVAFFGTSLTLNAKVGTAVAILGTYLYTEAVARAGKPAAPKLA